MKIMKRLTLVGLAGAGMLVAASAWAATNTNYFTITELQSRGGGYKIYPLGGSTSYQGCPNTDYYEIDSSPSAAEKEVMSRTLLSAFLAGRKVALRVSTTSCSPDGRPWYHQVHVDRTQ